MDKLLLKVPKPIPHGRSVVRLDDEAARIVGELYAKTGFPINQIVSQMVKFSADRVEVVYE